MVVVVVVEKVGMVVVVVVVVVMVVKMVVVVVDMVVIHDDVSINRWCYRWWWSTDTMLTVFEKYKRTSYMTRLRQCLSQSLTACDSWQSRC